MYDTMPSFWKKINVEQRQELMNQINAIYKEASNQYIWTLKTNLLKFANIMSLKHVPTLQTCHQVTKNNPKVLIRASNKSNKQDPQIKKTTTICDNSSPIFHATNAKPTTCHQKDRNRCREIISQLPAVHSRHPIPYLYQL